MNTLIATALPVLVPALFAPVDLPVPPPAPLAAEAELVYPAPAVSPRPAAALRDVTINGSGCRGGSASAALAPEGDAILVDFDALSANPTTGPAYRSCTLVATLDALPGHRVAVTGISAAGSADVRGGGRAMLIVRQFQVGNPASGLLRRSVVGPFRGAIPLSWSAPQSAWSWSGCGASQSVVVTASAFVDAGRGRAGGRAGIEGIDLELAVAPCM